MADLSNASEFAEAFEEWELADGVLPPTRPLVCIESLCAHRAHTEREALFVLKVAQEHHQWRIAARLLIDHRDSAEFADETARIRARLPDSAWMEDAIANEYVRASVECEAHLALLREQKQAHNSALAALAAQAAAAEASGPPVKRAKAVELDTRDHLRNVALFLMHQFADFLSSNNPLPFRALCHRSLWNIEQLYQARNPTASRTLYGTNAIRQQYGPMYESAHEYLKKFRRRLTRQGWIQPCGSWQRRWLPPHGICRGRS
eukprot:m.13446 g.13446  ORF g.13446 m.13446 type:complete len:262 (-) comp2827_c0_seq1:335-1120(-)